MHRGPSTSQSELPQEIDTYLILLRSSCYQETETKVKSQCPRNVWSTSFLMSKIINSLISQDSKAERSTSLYQKEVQIHKQIRNSRLGITSEIPKISQTVLTLTQPTRQNTGHLTKDSPAMEGQRGRLKYPRRGGGGGGDWTQVRHMKGIRVQTDKTHQESTEIFQHHSIRQLHFLLRAG